MGQAKPVQLRSACTTCQRRSAYRNADGLCRKCSVRASADERRAGSTTSRDADLAPRRGWDSGVCIRCGFIKTCQERVCRDCRELS